MFSATELSASADRLRVEGQWRDAERAYLAALQLDQQHFPALHGLGGLYLEVGRFEQARVFFERATLVNPSSAGSHNDLGIALNAVGLSDGAIAEFEKALQLSPDDAATHNNLGSVYVEGKRDDLATGYFRKAIALKPDYSDAKFNLANALLESGSTTEAIDLLRDVLKIRPDPDAYIQLGIALHLRGQPELAVDSFNSALAINATDAGIHYALGRAHETLGNIDAARKHFEKAVEFAPARPTYHRALAAIKRFKLEDEQLTVLENLRGRSAALSKDERVELHYALAKAREDLGQHDVAFRHLMEGSGIKRQLVRYDERSSLALFDRIARVFTKDFLQQKSGVGDLSQVPIFIVGMPRSGTTLVEQVLASHPSVFGAGELSHLRNEAMGVHDRDQTSAFPEDMASWPKEAFTALGERYIDHLRTHAPAALRITDKMPANFRFLGLIHLALPKARIIHVKRSAVDTCFSCFSTLFGGTQPFTYDLRELGRYYRAYEALMAHWRRVLPENAIFELQYEDLVRDFEAGARRIIAYCSLPWDDACLAFHKTARPVQTASAGQVRTPLYAHAIGRAKPYEKFLAPLLKELGLPANAG